MKNLSLLSSKSKITELVHLTWQNAYSQKFEGDNFFQPLEFSQQINEISYQSLSVCQIK